MGKRMTEFLASLDAAQEERVIAHLRTHAQAWPMTPAQMLDAGVVALPPARRRSAEELAAFEAHGEALAARDRAAAAVGDAMAELRKLRGGDGGGASVVWRGRQPDEGAIARQETLIEELQDAYESVAQAEVAARPHVVLARHRRRRGFAFPLAGRLINGRGA